MTHIFSRGVKLWKPVNKGHFSLGQNLWNTACFSSQPDVTGMRVFYVLMNIKRHANHLKMLVKTKIVTMLKLTGSKDVFPCEDLYYGISKIVH